MEQEKLNETIRRILAGDIDLYAEIISLYHRDVRQIVNAMLYGRGDTQELVQDVFVAAFQHLDQFRLGTDFEHWIREVARNTVRKDFRRHSRECQRLDTYRENVLVSAEEERRNDLKHHRAEALARCRKDLPPDCETGFELRYTDNLSFEKIAQTMGRTADGVRKMLDRARLMLRECIRKHMTQPGLI